MDSADSSQRVVELKWCYQGKGIGEVLLNYLTYLAKHRGLLGFTADVLVENRNMLEKMKPWVSLN